MVGASLEDWRIVAKRRVENIVMDFEILVLGKMVDGEGWKSRRSGYPSREEGFYCIQMSQEKPSNRRGGILQT
jgi:hypothetical protein